eukprot:gene7487-11811_t
MGQNPTWCSDATTEQNANTFTLCSNPGKIVDRKELSSWCHKRNHYSEMTITLKDHQFNNNCTLPHSHCVEAPTDSRFMKANCFKEVLPDDVTFSDGTKTFANSCRVANFVQPFEILHSVLKVKKELLYISTQTGFTFIDFNLEKPAEGDSTKIEEKASFDHSEIVSDTFEKVYIVGVKGNKIYSWSLEWSNNGLVTTFVGEGSFIGTFSSLTAFYDTQSKQYWAAISFTDKIEFYQIDKNTITATQKWSLNVPVHAGYVKISNTKFAQRDKTAFEASKSIQCLPTVAGTDRTLIMIYTKKSVYVLGFVSTQTGNHPIDLTEENAIGKYLYYEAPTGKFISAAHIYKDCLGDSKGQQVWLAVAYYINGQDSFKLQMVSLSEFSQVDFTCIGDGSTWWKNPSASRKDGGTCEVIKTACTVSTDFREWDTTKNTFECKTRPTILEKSLSEKVHTIRSALSTDIKAITAATDLQHAFMRVLFLAGIHHIDVIGVQEKACEIQAVPTVSTLTTIPASRNVHNIAVSHNAQHLFSSLSARDWELLTHARLAEICQKLKADPTNSYLSKFSEKCKVPTTELSIFDFMAYHSQCHGGWYCPLFGSVNQNTHQNRVEATISSGKHVIRPTKTYTCEPGFYCSGDFTAQRKKCPIGFKCPQSGMKYPIRCETGQNFDKACLIEGLSTETTCPSGLICKTARVALDSPPGYFVDGNNRRLFYQCREGSFCPLRNSKTSNATLCPAGFQCSEPSVAVPEKCISTTNTSSSHFCPSGTISDSLCPAGYECPTSTSKKLCEVGQYCPNGTMKATACPAGYYCPTPLHSVMCPRGFYCTSGSARPIRCQYLVWWCAEGTTEKQTFPLGLILVFVLVAVVAFSIWLFKWCCTKIKKRAKKKSLKSRRTQLMNRPFNLSLGYVPHPIDLQFEDLQFIKKKTNGIALDGITANFPNGSLIGVLSEELDDGKALADIIAGRSYYGFINGTIKANGVKINSLDSYSHLVGYVPEKDEYRHKFSIIDEIKWTAYPKMNNIFQISKTNKKIQKYLDILDIKYLQKKLCGKREDPLGLSNGQYKKIAIVTELVHDPSILVLVNPFDNVDLHEREELMEIFRKLNETNLTIIIILDQPRYEIFVEFDQVLLLGKQGQTVYSGPSRNCMQYFIELGFKCSKHGNPADLIMDIISGSVERNGDTDYSQEKLGYLWQIKQKENNKPWYLEDKKELDDEEYERHSLTLKKAKKNKRMGCLGQYIIFTIRSFIELLSHLKGTIYELLFVFIAASLIGSLYTNMEFVGPISTTLQKLCPSFANCELPVSDQIPTIGIVTISAIAFLSIQGSEKLFVFDKHLYKREVQSGISRIAYYMGKLTAHLPNNILIPALFLGIWEIFVAPRQLVFAYYGIYLLVNWCWSGFGYLNTLLFKRSSGLFYASMVVIWSSILSGFIPSLHVLNKIFFTQILSYLSPNRFALELFYISELETYKREGINVQTALNSYGYSFDFFWINILALLAFGLLFRILGFFVLFYLDPKVQTTIKFLYRGVYRKCCGKKKKKKELTLEESISQRAQEDVEDEYASDKSSGPDDDDED